MINFVSSHDHYSMLNYIEHYIPEYPEDYARQHQLDEMNRLALDRNESGAEQYLSNLCQLQILKKKNYHNPLKYWI